MKTTEKVQFTPGPWEIDQTDWPIIINGPVTGDNDPDCVAVIDCLRGNRNAFHYSAEVAAANARLIQAAPELLSALRDLVGIICGGERDVTLEDCDVAKAAIAKATQPQV